jgi:biotin carboxylase
MSRVLIIEPVSSGWSLIPKGKELNHEIVVFTYNQEDRIVPMEFLEKADTVVTVDTNNDEETIKKSKELHKEMKFDAVIPGFEYYVPLASKINNQLGLKGLNNQYINAVRYKDIMRDKLKSKGIKVPKYKLCKELSELQSAVKFIGGFPCVIKPVDCSGSLNVRKVDNLEELKEGYDAIKDLDITDLGRNARKDILMEEYLFGPEYSVEGYVNENKVNFLSITEKMLSQEPYFVEVGHIVSAQLKDSVRQEIYSYVKDVIRALNINLGPFHAELRVTEHGPVLIEIGARLAGDNICDLIYYSTGVDLYKIMFDSYLGNPIHQNTIHQERFTGIKYFIRPNLKKYTNVLGVDMVKQTLGFVNLNLTHPKDMEIPEATSFLGRLGYTIFQDSTYTGLKEKLNQADNTVKFI